MCLGAGKDDAVLPPELHLLKNTSSSSAQSRFHHSDAPFLMKPVIFFSHMLFCWSFFLNTSLLFLSLTLVSSALSSITPHLPP